MFYSFIEKRLLVVLEAPLSFLRTVNGQKKRHLVLRTVHFVRAAGSSAYYLLFINSGDLSTTDTIHRANWCSGM
jgi:hypothetical protein